MTRVKKFLLLGLALVLLSQIPFAYRRYRLGRLSAAIKSMNLSPRPSDDSDILEGFNEYKGVVHVHSFLGGHSTGTFQEIISAANANQLHFVVMTEHVESEIDTSAMTLKGSHAGVIFINGNEVTSKTGDRILCVPGDVTLSGYQGLSAEEIATNSRAQNDLSFVAYPGEFKAWSGHYDGIEVYNVFTNAKQINRLVALFDTLWSHGYPDLVFANYLQRPDEELKKWDEMLSHEKAVAIAGNDSHANLGISLNDSSGKQIMGLKLDPYEVSFRLVRVHVLVPALIADSRPVFQPLSEELLLDALRNGHCFIGFDFLGDTTGFRFEAQNGELHVIQGDAISLKPGTSLRVRLPVSGRVRLFRDGQAILDETGFTEKELPVSEKGVYRVEGYLPKLGGRVAEQPWIISNPIFVR